MVHNSIFISRKYPTFYILLKIVSACDVEDEDY